MSRTKADLNIKKDAKRSKRKKLKSGTGSIMERGGNDSDRDCVIIGLVSPKRRTSHRINPSMDIQHIEVYDLEDDDSGRTSHRINPSMEVQVYDLEDDDSDKNDSYKQELQNVEDRHNREMLVENISFGETTYHLNKVKGSNRCKDYYEQGYCMQGDFCIYDHGPDPVVVNMNSLCFHPTLGTHGKNLLYNYISLRKQ